MSLRYAVLAALVHGEATGYELAKRFDAGVANFWHARPQQIYAELTRLHESELVRATEVPQRNRPTKRVFALTDAGVAELVAFAAAPKQPTALRDELMIAVQAADVVDPDVLVEALDRQAECARRKLAHFRDVERSILSGRTEEEFLHTTRHLGPYLTCRAGIRLETETAQWCAWAIGLLRVRQGRDQAPKANCPTA
jgi:DNA-binding PadR family transcriptional regulator